MLSASYLAGINHGRVGYPEPDAEIGKTTNWLLRKIHLEPCADSILES
jgi:hypothetical protein